MLCYLCQEELASEEDFKLHILAVHRPNINYEDLSLSSEDSDVQPEPSSAAKVKRGKSSSAKTRRGRSSAAKAKLGTSSAAKAKLGTSSAAKAKPGTSSSAIAGACSSKASEHEGLTLVPLEVEDTYKKEFLANFVYDNKNDQLPLPNITGGFDFNPRNVQIWLVKFKELMSSKLMKYPLDPEVFKRVNAIHQTIFDNYCCIEKSDDLSSAVWKVYEELDYILKRHFISINQQL